jgi:hypothetical protein
MTTVTLPERKRGALLTGFLILMLIANVWTIYRYIVIIDDWLRHSDPNWNRFGAPFVLLTVLAAVNVVGVVLLWQWRIVGLYLFIAVSLIAFVINLILGVPLITALIGLIGMVILYALVNAKREMFS